MSNEAKGEQCRHAIGFEYMSDSPDETPIAVKAWCKKCRREWLFDASVKDDLMPLERQLADATASRDLTERVLIDTTEKLIAATAALAEAKKALKKYGSHTHECDLVSRRSMHPITAKTMDDVLGVAKCTCGWEEARLDATTVQPAGEPEVAM